MKKTVSGLTALLALAAAMTNSRATESAMLYVSTHCRSWTGKTAQPNETRTDAPFATIQRAHDEIRRMKKAGDRSRQGVIVKILGGKYELTRPVELTGEDAGTTTSPVTYRARPGDEVCISGGRAISGWTPVTDPAVLNRLDPAARAKVFQAGPRALGITGYGDLLHDAEWEVQWRHHNDDNQGEATRGDAAAAQIFVQKNGERIEPRLEVFCNGEPMQKDEKSKPPEWTINDGAQICFRHPLPAMRVNGKPSGLYNNPEVGLPGILTTRDSALGEMMLKLRQTINNERRLVFVNGRALMCNNNWIRDHVHNMKGFCHWEYDLRSFLDFIIDTQRDDGCFYELVKQMDDRHWAMVGEDSRVLYPEDNESLVRLEIEADIEYLVVEGAMRHYQATGDDEWLKRVLPKLEKGIDYATSNAKRWDPARGLVKRGFTIDTWDFTYRPDAGTNRRINAETPMGIMHGDNSGVFQAMNLLAWMNDRLDASAKATTWRKRANDLKSNMLKHLWNGRFFIHQLPLAGAGLDDKENVRLSLSNTYDMNRGVTTVEQSRSIIEEYMARRRTTKAFAEWFSIDPPYEKFGSYLPGRYVNGAISPFTAGELAKAAFRNGYESYGWDIICRFEQMIKRDNAIYFLYSPDDGKSQGGGPSAWGAAALLSAIDEGLAGISDLGVGYDVMEFAPRFPVSTNGAWLRHVIGQNEPTFSED